MSHLEAELTHSFCTLAWGTATALIFVVAAVFAPVVFFAPLLPCLETLFDINRPTIV